MVRFTSEALLQSLWRLVSNGSGWKGPGRYFLQRLHLLCGGRVCVQSLLWKTKKIKEEKCYRLSLHLLSFSIVGWHSPACGEQRLSEKPVWPMTFLYINGTGLFLHVWFQPENSSTLLEGSETFSGSCIAILWLLPNKHVSFVSWYYGAFVTAFDAFQCDCRLLIAI